MKKVDFLKKAKIVSKKYRAECLSNNRHWKGVWRDSYAEAFNDADKHRYAPGGKNQFHEIIIVEKVYSEAKVE